MTNEPKPFIEFWEAVDEAMLKLFGIDTSDAGIEVDLIASAHEQNQTPEEFVRWFGEKYDLTTLEGWNALHGVTETMGKTRKIAALNDECRTAKGLGSRAFQTPGISAMSLKDQLAIREKVQKFWEFNPGNDPHGERDFGAFEHNGQEIFWKIDYYDRTVTKGSEDPSDPKQTVRILTIMLASEY